MFKFHSDKLLLCARVYLKLISPTFNFNGKRCRSGWQASPSQPRLNLMVGFLLTGAGMDSKLKIHHKFGSSSRKFNPPWLSSALTFFSVSRRGRDWFGLMCTLSWACDQAESIQPKLVGNRCSSLTRIFYIALQHFNFSILYL